MAITHIANGTVDNTPALAPGLPTRVANDILVCFAVSVASATIAQMTMTGDWTLIADSGASTVVRIQSWWHRYNGTVDPSTAISSLTDEGIAVISSFRGALTSGSPIAVVGTANAGTDTPVTILGVTLPENDCLAVGFIGTENDELADAATTDWTALFNLEATSGAPDRALFAQIRILPAGGTGDVDVAGGWGSTDDWRSIMFALRPASAVQTITGSLYADGDTFHTAAITAGAVGITGSLYNDPDTFQTAVVTGLYTITGSLYSDADAFQTATLTTTYNIAGTLYSDGDTFYMAAVVSDQDIAGALYTDADAFFSAAITTQYAVTGALYSDPDTFQTAALTVANNITGSLYLDPDAFHTATVGSTYNIAGSLYSDPDTFYEGLVTQGVIVIDLHVDPDVFQTATITATAGIAGSLYQDPDTFHAAIISATNAISGSLYVDPDAFGTHSVLPVIGSSLYVDPDVFHTATITAAGAIVATTYIDPDTFYTAAITGGADAVGSAWLLRRRRRYKK